MNAKVSGVTKAKVSDVTIDDSEDDNIKFIKLYQRLVRFMKHYANDHCLINMDYFYGIVASVLEKEDIVESMNTAFRYGYHDYASGNLPEVFDQIPVQDAEIMLDKYLKFMSYLKSY